MVAVFTRLLLALGIAALGAQVDRGKADQYFKEAADGCTRDGGRLWGVSLCGPMVFADLGTHTLATNQPAPEGKWPATLGIVNAPIDWGGTKWSAYVWAMIPADNAQARRRLLLHELHHRIQPQIGQIVVGAANDHLDTLDGRYWLQLEWRALRRALTTSGSEALDAVRDALAFRDARRHLFPGSADSERADEIREGLAQYTGTVLAASSESDAVADAVRQLDDYAKMPSFVRTFAYPSGTAYGLLLDRWSPGWTHGFSPSADLGVLVMAAAHVEPAANADTVAARYGGASLYAAEAVRAREQAARIADLKRKYVDGPVLVATRGQQASIRTTGITPIPGEGRVIFQYQTTAEWGTLEATGVLVSDDGRLRLPLPYRTENGVLIGETWKITLASGWIVRPGARAGDLEVVREKASR